MMREHLSPREKKIRDAKGRSKENYIYAGGFVGGGALLTALSLLQIVEPQWYSYAGFGLGALAFTYLGSKNDRLAYSLEKGPTAASERTRMVGNAKDLSEKLLLPVYAALVPPIASVLDYAVGAKITYGHFLPISPSKEGILVNAASLAIAAGTFMWSRREARKAKTLASMPDAYFAQAYKTQALPRRSR